MGEGDQRNSIRTAALDPREIARLAKQSVLIEPVGGDAAADPAEPPLTGRTVTLDDPLTTSLLAEVTRTARTLEMTQEQLDAALARAAQSDDPAAEDAAPAAPAATVATKRR